MDVVSRVLKESEKVGSSASVSGTYLAGSSRAFFTDNFSRNLSYP